MLRSISLLGSLLLGAATAAAEPITTAADQAALSMTVYQQGLALVRDERTVELDLGRSRLGVLDVSDQIIPESVLVSGQGLVLHAAGYAGVSLTPRNLLAHYIGKTVRVVYREPQPGAPAVVEGVLLSATDGVPIVRIGDRVEIGGPGAPWRLAFDAVPEALRGQPTLTLDLENATRGPQSLVVTYLSQGLSWQADYVGVLQNDDSLLFSGWVSLENHTGTAYPSARVQLLAGDLHRPDEVRPMRERVSAAEVQQADLPNEPVLDYHVYSLPEPISLLPAQRRQLPLLAPRQVPLEREYRASSEAFRHAPEEEPVPVTVTVAEQLPADWQIQSSSHPHSKSSAQVAEWRIEVPPGGESTLSYRARVQY
jgi:hypothetical protein